MREGNVNFILFYFIYLFFLFYFFVDHGQYHRDVALHGDLSEMH